MKHKILIVDDEEQILSSLKRYLEYSIDCELFTANTFKQGIEVWALQSPSIILTDIMMPDGSGIELLQNIKPRNPSTQVIIMTGQTTLDRVLECMERGASDYLMKPLDMAIVEKLTKESMERYERWYQLMKLNLHKKRQEKAA